MIAKLMWPAGALLLAGCSGQSNHDDTQETQFVRAHDIKQLMAIVVEPQANVFWGSAGYEVDASGERDLTPTTDERWLATQSSAATVAEMGNLLMTPQYAEGRGEDWIQFSRALVEVGKRAEQAAIARDGAAVFEIGSTMYNVCQACHQVYPPATLAGTDNSAAPAPAE